MKFLYTLIIAVAVTLAAAISFCLGRSYEEKYYLNKYYEDACRMSDLIRCYEDYLREDSLIEDYGCFEELESTFLFDDAIGSPVNLKEYIWCY